MSNTFGFFFSKPRFLFFLTLQKDVNKIISDIANIFTVQPLTLIAATPHAPTRENYNLLAPNRQKYAMDIPSSPPSAEPSSLMTPLFAPITSPIAPLVTTPPQASQMPLGGATSGTILAREALAPLHQLPPTLPKAASGVTSPGPVKPLKTEKNHSLEKQDSWYVYLHPWPFKLFILCSHF